MSTVRVDRIELNQAGNAVITVANTYNVSVLVDGTEKIKVSSNGAAITGNATVSGGVSANTVFASGTVNAAGGIIVNNRTVISSSGVLNDLPTPGTSGNVLVSNGTSWTSTSATNGPAAMKVYEYQPVTGTLARTRWTGTAVQIAGSTTVTITTSTAHTLAVGDFIYVDNQSTGFTDGYFRVATVTSSTVFTIVVPSTTATSGNVLVSLNLFTANQSHGRSNGSNVCITANNQYIFDTAVLNPTSNTFQVYLPDSSWTTLDYRNTSSGSQNLTTAITFTAALEFVAANSNIVWTRPDGCKRVHVKVVGGGGGGAIPSVRPGGGGGYAEKIIDVTNIASANITVGYGGLGFGTSTSAANVAGGTSSFGSYVSALGGGTATANGANGVSGDINISGGGGIIGRFNGDNAPAIGGGSLMGTPSLISSSITSYANMPNGYISQGSGYGTGAAIATDGGVCPGLPFYIRSRHGVVIVTEYY